MVAKKDQDNRKTPYCNVGCDIDSLSSKVTAIHTIIVGDGKEPGLAEMVRTHNTFIRGLQRWQASVVSLVTLSGFGFICWVLWFAVKNGWAP